MRSTAREEVRARLAGSSAVPAILGHRGTGPTRVGHPHPENSVSSFIDAIDRGANGVELDAAITKDGHVVVMHDDTLDRTTDATGHVGHLTLDEVRACRLLDGRGLPTQEHPPVLAEVYGAIGRDALVNVELKVFEDAASNRVPGSAALTQAVLDEVTRMREDSRTIYSSFDEEVVRMLKAERPDCYAALISRSADRALIRRAVVARLDAVHLFVSAPREIVQQALDEGLQVTAWTANDARTMQRQIDNGVAAIITDEPASLAALIGTS